MPTRLLVATLAASNAVLILHAMFPVPFRKIKRWLMKKLLQHSPPASPKLRKLASADTVGAFALGGSLGPLLGRDYTPPLPKPVADALDRSCLCFLATTGTTLEPHLSLMRYTYTSGLDPNDEERSEVMVISTQRKTKKFDILTENENVALLVHDFQTHPSENTHAASSENPDYQPQKYSITLNGTVRVEEGALAEQYRQVHLARNSAYKQFIVGDDIAIITVHLTRARVCDVNDNVMHYSRDPSGKAWNELKP